MGISHEQLHSILNDNLPGDKKKTLNLEGYEATNSRFEPGNRFP
jgi:hypothetical protein